MARAVIVTLITLALVLVFVFTVWMIVDCARQERRGLPIYLMIIWIIIMLLSPPVGAVAYWFIVKKLNLGFYREKKRRNNFRINRENISSAEVDNKGAITQTSIEDKLRQLKELKEKNLINDEEYNKKKEKLLEEL